MTWGQRDLEAWWRHRSGPMSSWLAFLFFFSFNVNPCIHLVTVILVPLSLLHAESSSISSFISLIYVRQLLTQLVHTLPFSFHKHPFIRGRLGQGSHKKFWPVPRKCAGLEYMEKKNRGPTAKLRFTRKVAPAVCVCWLFCPNLFNLCASWNCCVQLCVEF